MAWAEHIPILIMSIHGIKLILDVRADCLGKLRLFIDFYHSFSCDREVSMTVRNIKVVHPIAQIITIGHNLRLWTSGQVKIETTLKTITTRLKTDLHNAFCDWHTIAKPSNVVDSIVHPYIGLSKHLRATR